MDNEFWQFSLRTYPQLKSLCLSLQAVYNLNVNLLLWSLWLAERQVPLNEARMREALARVEHCQSDYVLPLRQLREQLKLELQRCHNLAKTELRKQILKAELSAEQWMQQILFELSETWMSESGNWLEANLGTCLSAFNANAEMEIALKQIKK